MTKFKKGNIVKGTVIGIESYGAFVSCGYYTGLIHISEISYGYVKDINNFVKIGDIIYVEILDVDEQLGRLKLSIKNINYRNKKDIRRLQLKETKLGFKNLAYHLPLWIDERLKKIKNRSNSIDK